MDRKDLDSPRRELSNGGLGIVAALVVFSGIIFCVRISNAQSSCIWNVLQLVVEILCF